MTMKTTLPTLLLGLALVGASPVTAPLLEQDLELDGLIEPFADLNLGAQVDGVLAEILVERGETVGAGQVVARHRMSGPDASHGVVFGDGAVWALRKNVKHR